MYSLWVKVKFGGGDVILGWMDQKVRWKIEYYKTPSGKEVIQEFIDGLEPKIKGRINNTFELLAQFGPLLRMPHAKKIAGTSLWELRILGETSTRFFYISLIHQTFIVLHGFTKKKQKTPKKEIEIAEKRLRQLTI